MTGGCREDVGEWTRAVCKSCHKPFPRRGGYEKQCMVCYKEAKSYDLLVGDLSFLWAQRELAAAETRLAAAEKKLSEAKANPKKVRFKGDFLKKLVSLTHPDRHDGSPVATEVTQELLAMRTNQRRKKT